MSSLTSLVTATIAALALGGSAWAAVPAAGEEPEFNTLSSSSEFTRAEVEDEVRAEEAQGHAFPDASGDQRVQ